MEDVLVKCERLDDFGRGLGYVFSKVIFVPNLLPGEEALVNVVLDNKKYMVGEVKELIQKSPLRVMPKCAYENCGCALQNLSYSKTLEYKKNKVNMILRKFASVDMVLDIVPSDKVFGYRNKITLKVKDGKIGYFKNGTNELISIKGCALASDNINKVISVLDGLDLSLVKEIIIKDFSEVMIIIDGNMDITLLKPLASSIYMNGKCVYGNEFIKAKLGEYNFYVSKEAFFQVNMDVALRLYNKVLEYLSPSLDEEVLDLYCGTGTISLFLSKYFKKVTGVEINKEAVICANLNKKLNKVTNVSFICGDASEKIHELKASKVVVDPPRSGLTKRSIQDILCLKPLKLVYVSCDPMTLARDIKLLEEMYEVQNITLFDMFPWTYHVESCVLFSLKEDKKD